MSSSLYTMLKQFKTTSPQNYSIVIASPCNVDGLTVENRKKNLLPLKYQLRLNNLRFKFDMSELFSNDDISLFSVVFSIVTGVAIALSGEDGKPLLRYREMPWIALTWHSAMKTTSKTILYILYQAYIFHINPFFY